MNRLTDIDSSSSPCVCAGLRRASRSLTRIYDDSLAPVGLTVTQFSVLRTVSRLGSPTLSELADKTAHEKSGLWRIAQPLIRSGALTFGSVEGVRGRRLTLTASGQDLLAAAYPAWNEAQTAVSNILGTRKNQLIALLREIERLV
jgi:DNA-binding MarR family transcriptional regulator